MKKRIISAVVAAVIVIPLLIIGGYPYIIGISILAILALKEIIDLKKSHQEYPSLMMLFSLIGMLSLVLSNSKGYSVTYGITYQTILLITLSLLIPIVFYKNDKYTAKDAFFLLGSTLFLGIVFNLFIVLRFRGLNQMLYIIAIPMITDIFAYLGGKLLGRTKMCPKISPNKTWEGALCGLVAGTIAGTIIYSFLIGSFSLRLVMFSIILSVIGQVGDLIMSKIKRENDIKDFSNIMPGHGGILDRLDSIIFVIIAYVTVMTFI